jgi:hypothetical protein
MASTILMPSLCIQRARISDGHGYLVIDLTYIPRYLLLNAGSESLCS